MKKLILTGLAAAVASSAWAIIGTVRTEADARKGEIKWQPRDKSYAVTVVTKGGGSSHVVYPLASVVGLDIEKPKNFDRLVDLVRNKQGASAIKGLEEIVQTYKMLVWDKPAGRYLVQAYLAADQAKKAYEAARKIIDEDPTAAYVGELAPAYWRALRKNNETTKLENCLRMAATNGDRVSSAEALLMRGDVIIEDGSGSIEAHRKALAEGFLRVALMYIDPECKEVRRDAMNKCADSLDKIGHAARAEKMRSAARGL